MKALDKYLWKCVDALLLAAVLGMVVLISLQVGSRFVRSSVPWTEELSRFLFIWTIWMGLAASFRAGTHPAITFIPDMMPSKMRIVFRVIPVLATLVLFGAVCHYGYGLFLQQIRFGERSAILQIGMYWSTLPLVVGSGLAMIGAAVDGIVRDPLQNPVEEQVAQAGKSAP